MKKTHQPFGNHCASSVEIYRDDQWFCNITTRRRFPFLPFHWETEFWWYNDAELFWGGEDLTITLGRVFYRSHLKSRSVIAIHHRITDRLSEMGDSGKGLGESIGILLEELFAEGVIEKVVDLVSPVGAPPDNTYWRLRLWK